MEKRYVSFWIDATDKNSDKPWIVDTDGETGATTISRHANRLEARDAAEAYATNHGLEWFEIDDFGSTRRR